MIPPMPTAADERARVLQPYWIDATADYPEPIYTLEYRGVGFAPLGGLHVVTGNKKNGKTFLTAQLMAALLGRDVERMRARLPELKTTEALFDHLGHQPKVLYIDTEMEKLNTVKVMRRIKWLTDGNMSENDPNLRVLWLRDVGDPEKPAAWRWQMVQQAVEQEQPDVLFLDGIRDVVTDFNDMAESMTMVNALMKLSTQREMSVWTVLHYNPSKDFQKMRGHLGTELGNKASDVFACTKHKKDEAGKGNDHPGVTWFRVEQVDARGKDVESWDFEITADAGELGVPRMLDRRWDEATAAEATAANKPLLQDDLKNLRGWIEEAAKRYQFPLTRKEIKEKVLKEIGGITNDHKKEQYLTAAVNMRYLVESLVKVKGSFKLDINEELIAPF